MISFDFNSENQLLLNPKFTRREKEVLVELKNEFDLKVTSKNHFLIASSGSSQKSNTSVKLIALHIDKVLNSARRFNGHYKTNEKDNWGLVLPDYHVAGLGLKARAFLAEAEVFVRDWGVSGLASWISENKIRYISMVPAQIFDLVQKKINAPEELKKIFVGAGALNEELRDQAAQLGWPIVETYGMTETSSMIAIKEDDFFYVMPGVEVKTDADLLSIKCDSLLTATIQKIDDKIMINSVQENSWYQTEDLAELFKFEEKQCLKFLGRRTDYIKILGEGVSLTELRDKFSKLVLLQNLENSQFELTAVEDPRSGYKLVLAVESSASRERANELADLFNKTCRPYEKITQSIVVGQIPRAELGKLKTEELKRIVNEELKKDDMAKINKTPWEIGSIFLCTKCGAKYNEPNLAEEVKSEIRKKQKDDETQGKIRVITSACLGICYPEKQAFAFMPTDGKTEVYTTDLNKQVVLQEITELMGKKINK